jgi:phage head maturation protease
MDSDYFEGDAVKALGDGRIGGYLVRFTTATDPDLTGDFFAPDTDFFLEDSTKAWVLYDHGRDATLKARKLGRGDLRIDDVGVWIEAQLNIRDAYEKAIYKLAKEGKLGWSSGALNHLVERKMEGKAARILTWPIGEASLTPNPAEFRNGAFELKSYVDQQARQDEVDRADNLDVIASTIVFDDKTEAAPAMAAAAPIPDEPLVEATSILPGTIKDNKWIVSESYPALKQILLPVEQSGGGLNAYSDAVVAAVDEQLTCASQLLPAVKRWLGRMRENTQFRFEKDGQPQSKPKRRSVEITLDRISRHRAKFQELEADFKELLAMFDMTDAQQAATNEKARHELFRSQQLSNQVKGV